MSKRFSILLITLTMLVFVSCGEDKNTEEIQDDSSSGLYSGITSLDEPWTFKSVDPDDWRSDGILTNCIAFPNPIDYSNLDKSDGRLNVWYKVSKKCGIAMIIRDINGNIVPEQSVDTVLPKRFTFADGYHGKADHYSASLRLCSFDGVSDNKLKPGLYRLFIYASEDLTMRFMLRDTGVSNVTRDKYSMVYGDIQIK